MPCLDGCVCTVLPPLYCRGHAHSLRSDHKDLWVVFFPRCTAGPKLVGSCCIRLHTTANTNATTPNIVAQQCWELLRPFALSLRLLNHWNIHFYNALQMLNFIMKFYHGLMFPTILLLLFLLSKL